MRWLFTVGGLVCLCFVPIAKADTVYLKNGDTVWGSEVTETDAIVLVYRAGEKLELRKVDVDRIERARLSIPRYYAAPEGGGFTASAPAMGAPGGPGVSGPPGMPPGMPGPPGMPPMPGGPGVTGAGTMGVSQPGASAASSPGMSSSPSGPGATPIGPSGGPVPGGGNVGVGTSVTSAPTYGPPPPGSPGPGQGMSPRDRDVPPVPR